MSICVHCEAPVEGTVYRNTLCPGCGKELHSCLNCRHYDKGRPYDCNESIREPVTDKSRANFCDFFQINTRKPGTVPTGGSDNADAKDALDALFGD